MTDKAPPTDGRILQWTAAEADARNAPVLGRRQGAPAAHPALRGLPHALLLSPPAVSRLPVAPGALDRSDRAWPPSHVRDQPPPAARFPGPVAVRHRHRRARG